MNHDNHTTGQYSPGHENKARRKKENTLEKSVFFKIIF